MFKSLFWKQFMLYIGTILLSFTLLAFAASQAFKSYFVNRQEQLLQKQGERIVEIMLESFGHTFSRFNSRSLEQRMEDQVKSIQSYMDASVLFIDRDYKVFMATSDVAQSVGTTLSSEFLSPVMEGKVVSVQGQLTELFPTKMLTVAYPIVLEGQVSGAIILNASIPELERTVSDVVRITVFSTIVAGLVAFVFVYFSSRTIVRPLQAMNEAAKVIAGGDFEKRLVVSTRDEVGQLGESFNNMAESLAQQEQFRREFISNISHDLRTPLTSMRGFLGAILDGTIPTEDTGKYLGIALEETERLTKLANDMLDLNRLQGVEHSLTFSKFDIDELIRKIVPMFEARITDGEIALSMNLAGGVVSADYEKIQRVVYNLLDNAVKFTQANCGIEIATTANDKKVFVKIKDYGCGISSEQQKRIFERFYKADPSRGESGSGLGLSIVQAFIKAHGESITLKSTPGEGSEFVFTLSLFQDLSKPL